MLYSERFLFQSETLHSRPCFSSVFVLPECACCGSICEYSNPMPLTANRKAISQTHIDEHDMNI